MAANNMYNILYVDDEEILLTATKLYLEHSGEFVVDTASSADEGLNKIYGNNYDAVVSDYEMPEMNGVEFLSKVRSTGNDIPFIIFTGRGREDVVIDALNNGADFYLQKGGQPKAQFAELTSKISQAVRRKKAESEIEAGKKQMIALLNAASEAEMLISPEGGILAINSLMAERFGRDPKFLLGASAFESLPLGLFNLQEIIFSSSSDSSGQLFYEEISKGRYYNNTISPLADISGNIVSYAVFSKDITAQQNAEDSLAAAKEHLDVTLKSIGDGVIVTDEHTNITALNRVAEELTGWREDDAKGMHVLDVFSLSDLLTGEVRVNPAEEAIRSGKIVNLSDNIQLESKDGSKYIIGDSAAPIKDQNSEVRGSVIVFRDITKEKEAQDYQMRLASIIDSADDAIISKNTDGTITSWNKGAEEIFGYSEEEVVGKKINLLVLEEDADDLKSIMDKISLGEKIKHHTARRMRKDGQIIDVSLTISPITDINGKITGISTISRDVSDIIKSRHKLKESYEWNSTVLKSIGDAIIATDRDCNVTYMNPVSEHLTGWSLKEAKNRPLSEIFNITNESTGDVVESPAEKVIKEGRVVGLANHTVLTGKSGEIWPIDDSGAPIVGFDGKINGAVIVFREISERKKSEKLLKDSEARYRALFNSTGAATVIYGPDNILLLVNSGYEKLSGYSRAEVEGRMRWTDFVHEDDLSFMLDKYSRRPKGGEFYHDSYEFRFVDRSGRIHDILLIFERIVGSSNVVCNLIDITAQKTVQRQLSESENKLKTILDSLPDVVVHKDPELRILWANATAKKMNPDIVGKTCYEAFLGCEKVCDDCNALKSMESGEIRSKTIFHRGVAGVGDSYWEKTSIPIKDYSGRYSSVVEMTRNVTSSRQSERRTVFQHNLAEKLSATSSLQDALKMIFESLTGTSGMNSGMLYLSDRLNGGLSLTLHRGISGEYKSAVSSIRPESPCFGRLAHKKPVYGVFDDISPNLKDISRHEGIKSFAYLPIVAGAEIIGAYFLFSRDDPEVTLFSKDILESVNDLIGNTLSRVIAEEALRESGERLNIALKSAELFVWEYMVGENKVFWDHNLLKGLGYSCGNTVDSVWWESLIHPEDRNERRDKLSLTIIGSENYYSNEYRILSAGGEWRWIRVLGKAKKRDDEGFATHLAGVIQDITESKEGELALIMANKKLNLLSSITRHDILNRVTPTLMYLEMIRELCEGDDKVTEYLNFMEKSVNDVTTQISFTKDYQDLGLKSPQWQNVGTVLDNAGLNAGISSVSVVGSDLCCRLEVLADPMFEKIFFNLIDNSLRHGGEVSEISVRCIDDGDLCKVIYTDDGCGVSPDMKEKIFYKGVGSNTGLGLFLTKEILDITGILVEENGIYGEGARFEISVPKGKWRYSEDYCL
ncbi:PAS domain S-box protein [Methanoplanus endosymbiosus]|uniref:histidine kinase n=1 Tax=Methanoplanus endosymbiosus TaxID=33865 RepID=A0A9E7PK54_9EURY|nr:PAS domain S-box protein [Methanoplanus endosymbiosus]UUX91240.1 PAS domain S-box protein [Methanoplanus endosymbiosus]